MNQSRMPSPAILVAVLALVAAVAGTAIAAPDALKRAITKPQLRELIKKEVAKQLQNATPTKAFTLTLDDETGNVVADGFRLRFEADVDGFCQEPRIIALADDSRLWMSDEFGDNEGFGFEAEADISVWGDGEQVTVDARTLDGSGVAQFEFATESPVTVNGNDECLVTGTAFSN